MNKHKLTFKKYFLPVITLITGLLLGAWIFGESSDKKTPATEKTQTDKLKKQTWTCSMHPQIRRDAPGQCPICGMDLIPLEQDNQNDQPEPNAITLSDEAIKLAQIQTYKVTEAVPSQNLNLSGTIEPDERRSEKLTARFSGRIEKLYLNFTGQKVFRGQKIAEIYSPELISAQRELQDAAQYKDSQPALYQAARHKLELWNLTPDQIDRLEKMSGTASRFPILSPVSGFVLKRNIAEGDYVKQGQNLFNITPLHRVWIMLDAYEKDLHHIRKGNPVIFTVDALPGKHFKGKVNFIDPFVNPDTRVAKVRVEFKNKNLQLKPGMFVNATVQAVTGNKPALLIPKTAVLWTGKRSVVYVKKGNNFAYREIILGPEAGDYYVVISGLKSGDEIVRNGVFKVDAAAQLLGKTSMMNPESSQTNTGYNHNVKPVTDENSKQIKTEKKMDKTDNKSEKMQDMKCGAGKCGADMKNT